jgi:hypothetical protein
MGVDEHGFNTHTSGPHCTWSWCCVLSCLWGAAWLLCVLLYPWVWQILAIPEQTDFLVSFKGFWQDHHEWPNQLVHWWVLVHQRSSPWVPGWVQDSKVLNLGRRSFAPWDSQSTQLDWFMQMLICFLPSNISYWNLWSSNRNAAAQIHTTHATNNDGTSNGSKACCQELLTWEQKGSQLNLLVNL